MLTFISFIEIPLSAVLSTTCLIKLIHLFHIMPRRPLLQSFTHGALPLCINSSCYLRLQIVAQKYVILTKLQLIKCKSQYIADKKKNSIFLSIFFLTEAKHLKKPNYLINVENSSRLFLILILIQIG